MSIADKLKAIADNEQKIYETGKQSEYDSFWDSYQDSGNRVNYNHAFANPGWKNDVLKPKFPIVPTLANSLFLNCRYNGDITEQVTLDFSNCTNFSNMCGYAYGITRFGVVDTRAASALNAAFYYARGLVTIDKLILKDDGTQTFNNVFAQNYDLENLTIEGVIGQNGFNVGDAKALTRDSLMSIINALADGVSAKTCTLGTANLVKLTDQEKAIATQKGWTLA